MLTNLPAPSAHKWQGTGLENPLHGETAIQLIISISYGIQDVLKIDVFISMKARLLNEEKYKSLWNLGAQWK